MHSPFGAGTLLAVGLFAALFGKGATANLAGEGRQIDDNMMEYPTGDLTIEEANDKARATLQRFFDLSRAGLRGTYLLKMSLSDGSYTEHIWMDVSGYSDGVFHGTLANDPRTEGHAFGDPVTLPLEKIEDWMINTGSERYGGYTIRAMLDDMPEEQAEAFRAQFRD